MGTLEQRQNHNGSTEQRKTLRDIRSRYRFKDTLTQKHVEDLARIINEAKSDRNKLMALRLWLDIAKHLDSIELKLHSMDIIESHLETDHRHLFEQFRKAMQENNDPERLEAERRRAMADDGQSGTDGESSEPEPVGDGEASRDS